MTHDTGEFEGMCPTCGQPYCWAEIERLRFIERNMLIENERLRDKLETEIEQMRERIHALITEREAERKIYNDAIAEIKEWRTGERP